MVPIPFAFAAFKAASMIVNGVKSAKSHSTPQTTQKPVSRVPRPNLKNAPNFAKIFAQETLLNQSPLSETVANRMVAVSHKPMRSEKMEQFKQLISQAQRGLGSGTSQNSPKLDEFRQFIRKNLNLDSQEIRQVISQLSELTHASPQAQNQFLATKGASLQF